MKKLISYLLMITMIFSMLGTLSISASAEETVTEETTTDETVTEETENTGLVLDVDFSTYTGAEKTITDKTGNVNKGAFLLGQSGAPTKATFQLSDTTDEISYLKFKNSGENGIRISIGNDDYTSNTYPLRDLSQAVSFETWVYTTSATGSGATQETIFCYRIGTSDSGTAVKRAVFDNKKLVILDSDTTSLCSTSISDKIGEHNWHHVVVTFSAPVNGKSTVTTYMDGVQLATSDHFDNSGTGTPYMLYLGSMKNAGSRPLKGGMATFKAYNKVLSSEEVSEKFYAEAENYIEDVHKVMDLDFSTYTGAKTITDKTGNVDSGAFLIAGTQPTVGTFKLSDDAEPIKYLKFSNGGIRTKLDGSYTSVTYPLLDVNKAVSYETWVYSTNGTGDQEEGTEETLFAFRATPDGKTSDEVNKRAIYSNNRLYVKNVSSTYRSADISGKTGEHEWHHIVVTFTAPVDGKSTVTTYMDGVQYKTTDSFVVTDGRANMLCLGCLDANGKRPLKGGMATFKAYNKILSSTEVREKFYEDISLVKSVETVYEEFRESVSDAGDLGNKIAAISSLLDETAWAYYQKLDEENVDTMLYAALLECELLTEFQSEFINIVNQAYWQGYELRLNIETELGGARGKILVDGEDIPVEAYAVIELFDDNEELLKSFTVNVKEGVGYYNIYGEATAKVNVTLRKDLDGTQQIAATSAILVEEVYIPEIFITELTNHHTQTYYPDENGIQNNGSTTSQRFQFVELCNYSDTPVDLSEYTFVYTTDSEHKFDWIKESDGSYIINPGDVYVIGVYSKWSADEGYKYDGDAELLKYWEGFNDFYNVNIPKTNRVMIACVESGNGDNLTSGMTKLLHTSAVGAPVTAEMRKDGKTVTRVSMNEGVLGSHSYHFMPTEVENLEEKLLFCAAPFPYNLLDEQKFDYCEKAYFDNNGKTKVMSYNILATNDAGYTVAERFPLVMRTVESFDPDIIGFQEVNKLWIENLKTGMVSGYSYVEGISVISGKTYSTVGTDMWDCFVPIYYKTDKYNLLDSGYAYITPDGNMSTPLWDSLRKLNRTMTWAVLEDKETKEVVSVINSHLTLTGKVARSEQTKLLYKKGKELKEQYGGGIVIVGDHNFAENSEPYHEYVNSGIVSDSKYLTTNHNSSKTYFRTIADPNDEGWVGTTIDFCFVSPEDYDVQKYEVVTGAYAEGAGSDHLAVTVELLDKNLITEHKNEIITYDKSKNSVFAEFVAGKEYQIIFADYENGKLVNSEIVPFKAGCDCYAWIKQSKTDLSLGKEDKIFIWDIKEGLKPVCNLYELSE